METRDLVKKTADELLCEGIKPTVASIRGRTQRGSANTINAALSDWWQDLAVRMNMTTSRPDIPEPVFEVASQIWIKALAEADQSMATYRQEANKQVEEANSIRDTALLHQSELEKQNNALTEQLNQTNQSSSKLEQDISHLQTEKASLKERVDQLQARLQDKELELSSVHDAHEKQLKLDNERYISMEKRLVSQLDEQRTQRLQTEKTLETKEKQWQVTSNEMSAELLVTQKQLEVTKNDLSAQKKLAMNSNEELKQLRTRNETLIAQNSAMNSDLSHQKIRIDEFIASDTTLKENIQLLQNKITDQEKFIQELKKRLIKNNIKKDLKS